MTNFCKRDACQPRRCVLHSPVAEDRRGRRSWIVGFLAALLLVVIHCPQAQAAQNASLAWEASPDSGVAGYNIYYGGASGNYTNVISAGNTTSTSLAGLVEGATYYFAVTAVDAFGVESGFSNEAAYVVSGGALQLQIGATAGGAFSLTGRGQTGHVYEIQATTNLVAWATIGIQTADSNGSFVFIDYAAPNYPTRFYRTHDTQP